MHASITILRNDCLYVRTSHLVLALGQPRVTRDDNHRTLIVDGNDAVFLTETYEYLCFTYTF